MAISKIILNNTTQMDLTTDTVTTSDHIMEGYVGHLRNGTSVTGTGKIAASEQAALDALVRYSNEVTGESDETISEAVETLVDGYENKSFWVKPDDWPDIESIDIPDDLDYDVRYLLYDRLCGVDEVSFLADTKMTVYKGTVVNGIFIGDEQANNITSFTDTLTERFTVYKVTGGNNFRFRKGVSNAYASSIQSLVWKYGKIPSTAYVGGSGESAAPWSIHTERVKLLNGINLLQLTLPTESTIPLKSLELGVKENGDFTGRLATSGLTRGGNGILFHQHPDDKNPLVIKNLKMNFSATGRFCQLNNVIFDNVELSFANQNFQGSKQLRNVKFINSNVTCTDMYYQFESCINLVNCDLSEVDFSTCTRSGSAFANCYSLKNLKLNNTWKMALNLAKCFSLTKESILDIFNVLPTLSEEESFTITLPYAMKNYLLTAEEKAIVTNKGWTIA